MVLALTCPPPFAYAFVHFSIYAFVYAFVYPLHLRFCSPFPVTVSFFARVRKVPCNIHAV